jgi:hypothetical protein
MASIKSAGRGCGRIKPARGHQHQSVRYALFIILILSVQSIQAHLAGDNEVRPPSGRTNETTPMAAKVVAGTSPTKAAATAADDNDENRPGAQTGDGENGDAAPPEVTTTLGTLSGSPDVPLPDGADENGLGAALAAAEAKRAASRKDSSPASDTEPAQPQTTTTPTTATTATTTETTTTTGASIQPAAQDGRQREPAVNQSLSDLLVPAAGGAKQAGDELARMSPALSGAIGDIAQQLPSVYGDGQNRTAEPEPAAIERLLPKDTNLFDSAAVDASQFGEMDCHLRNIDYCLAGLIGTSQKVLPETNKEFETRCDEMKATTSCMAVYNKRCSTLRVFSMLAPFMPGQGADLLPSVASSSLSSSAATSGANQLLLAATNGSSSSPVVSLTNLMELCEPRAKGTPANTELRKRLFQMAKCINPRVPMLSPCLDDLKTAVQLFYEPRRVLPMRPTCCALARFRACSANALDGVCGLSSFEQLLESVSGQGGPVSMVKSIDRVCRQATDPQSSYCKEVLPPSGMKLPQRRGRKASKLAKALELISFAPSAQGLGLA